MGNARNNERIEPGEPGNDGVLHYLLRPSKSPSCLGRLHSDQNGTRGKHRCRKHHCNTIWLWDHHRQPSEGHLEYVPRQSSSPGSSALPDLHWLRGRSCFFLADEGEELVQFGVFHLLWHSCWWQEFGVSLYPIRHALRVHLQLTPDPPQVRAVHIELYSLLANFRTVAAGFLDRSIFVAA